MKFIPKEYDFHPNEFDTCGINSVSMYDFHTLCGTYADVFFLILITSLKALYTLYLLN